MRAAPSITGGTLTVTNSTFFENHADGLFGGGRYLQRARR